jgi:alkaline phosphatase D
VLLAAGPAAAEGLLVTVGEVGPSAAVIWARGAAPGPITVQLTPSGGEDVTRAVIDATRTDDLTGKAVLRGLSPRTVYTYRLESAGQVVSGAFATAPRPDEAARVTFLWSGDLGGGGFCRRLADGYPIFRAMARLRAHFFLFVGDTIYADRRCDGPGVVPGADFVATSLREFRERHRYNREDAAVQEFFRTTPVFAIWDDHEVRNDFAGPTEPLMVTGRRAFLEYWPLMPPAEEPTRMYRKFRWGRLLEVFILDTRQYRSPNTQPDGPGKTMLGAPQRRWLVENVATSTALWKVVVSSVSLAIPTGRPERRDSWSNASIYGLPQPGAGFATERDAILRSLRERGTRNLVFIVADVHHAELIQHRPAPDFVFHELVAGPLSASLGRPRPLDAGLNPRSLFAVGGVNNFGEVTVEPSGLTVRFVDEAGTVLHVGKILPE